MKKKKIVRYVYVYLTTSVRIIFDINVRIEVFYT